MDGTTKVLAVLFVTWLVTVPVGCLAHELAHAFAIWRRTGRRSFVTVGRETPLLEVRMSFCDLHFHPLVEEAWCWFDSRGTTVDQARSIARAGSLADAVMMLCLAAIAYAVGDPESVWFWIAAVGFVLCGASSIFELIPINRPGQVSDGGYMMGLRGRRGDEPA